MSHFLVSPHDIIRLCTPFALHRNELELFLAQSLQSFDSHCSTRPTPRLKLTLGDRQLDVSAKCLGCQSVNVAAFGHGQSDQVPRWYGENISTSVVNKNHTISENAHHFQMVPLAAILSPQPSGNGQSRAAEGLPCQRKGQTKPGGCILAEIPGIIQ